MEGPLTINLNIGGQIYTTTIDTLTRQPNSLFTAMFQEQSLQVLRDSEKNVFIDRDGNNFRFVLNFLRSSELNLPRDFQDFKNLASDAEFYRLPALKKAVEKQEQSMKNGAVEFVHVTFQAHTNGKYRCHVGAHLWEKVTVVAREDTMQEIFPDNGKAIQENAIYTKNGLNLMAGYGFSETGILKIPSHYGRLQENLSSLQFHSAEYNYAFKISGPIPAHRYYLCPDFHKWLLALFSSYGFKLKGVNESNTTNTNATNSPELSTSQTHAFVPLRDCIGPHVQNFDWYFVRK